MHFSVSIRRISIGHLLAKYLLKISRHLLETYSFRKLWGSWGYDRAIQAVIQLILVLSEIDIHCLESRRFTFPNTFWLGRENICKWHSGEFSTAWCRNLWQQYFFMPRRTVKTPFLMLFIHMSNVKYISFLKIMLSRADVPSVLLTRRIWCISRPWQADIISTLVL